MLFIYAYIHTVRLPIGATELATIVYDGATVQFYSIRTPLNHIKQSLARL